MATPRILAGVSYARVSATVTVQNVQAYVTLDKDGVLSRTYVVPVAALKYINIVMYAEADPIGRNPVLREISYVVDQHRLGVGKNVADLAVSTDDVVKAEFKKVPNDNTVTSETKHFDVSAVRADTFHAVDAQAKGFVQAPRTDSVTKSDHASPHMNKRPSDPVATADAISSRAVTKARTDQATLSELRTMFLSKKLNDTVDAGDELNASVGTDDGEVMALYKVLSDFAGSADAKVYAFAKSLADQGHTTDSLLRLVQKAVVDSFATSDAQTHDIQKVLNDVADAGDEWNTLFVTDDGEVFMMYKALEDAFTQSDFVSVQAEKNLLSSNPTTSDELLPFVLGKGTEDVPVTSEGMLFVTTKQLADTWTFSDSTSNNTRKVFSEYRGTTEGPGYENTYALDYFATANYVLEPFPVIDFRKALADTPDATDAVVSAISKPRTDSATAVDTKGILTGKTKSESLSTSDTDTVSFGKAGVETLATAEQTVRNISKALAELVDATDDFYGVTNADDDQIMVFAKLTSDYASTGETRTVTIAKPLTDTASKSDLLTSSLSKPASDTVAKSDSTAKAAGKPLSDLITNSDSSRVLTGKGATDSATTSEVRVASVGKALADSASKSDSLALGVSKPASDSFTSSDSRTNAFGKGSTDTATTSESKQFAISKSLSDLVDATDAYAHIAVLDDDENMLFGKISADVVTKSDLEVHLVGKRLTESVGKSDSGSLRMTSYSDVNYFASDYVGTSLSF